MQDFTCRILPDNYLSRDKQRLSLKAEYFNFPFSILLWFIHFVAHVEDQAVVMPQFPDPTVTAPPWMYLPVMAPNPWIIPVPLQPSRISFPGRLHDANLMTATLRRVLAKAGGDFSQEP